MSWKDHLISIISKLNSCLGATRKARSFLSKNALLTVFHSLMQSQVNYCIETWGSWEPRGNKTILQRMQAVPNKYFRLLYNLDRTESVRHLSKSHNILNVNIRQNYDFRVCSLMHKAVNGVLPTCLSDVLTTSNEFFFFKSPRLKQTEKSVMFAAPKLWNSLPTELITEPNFNRFKINLKALNRNIS